MKQQFHLHELAVEDANHGHQRPKIEEYGATVFVVMQMIERAPDSEPDVGELCIFVGPNFVLSVRKRSAQGFLGVRERAEREPQMLSHGSAFVLYALMDAVVDRYFPVIEQMEDELERIEAAIFEPGNARQNIQQLYALKRSVAVLRHAVAPLMEATGKLFGGRVPQACQNTQEYFRDIYDHLVRCNTTLETLRETVATAIQVNLSMVTIEDSEDHQIACRLGRHLRRGHLSGRRLGNEFHPHARIAMDLWLPAGARTDRRGVGLFVVALPPGGGGCSRT